MTPHQSDDAIHFCPKCGTARAGNEPFCAHCGNTLESQSHASTPTTAPAPAAAPAARQAIPLWAVASGLGLIAVAVIIGLLLIFTGDDGSRSTASHDSKPSVAEQASDALTDVDDAHRELERELAKLQPSSSSAAAVVAAAQLEEELQRAGESVDDIDADTAHERELLRDIDSALSDDQRWLEALTVALRSPSLAHRTTLLEEHSVVEDSWDAVKSSSDGDIVIQPDGSVPAASWVQERVNAQKARAQAKARARAAARKRAQRRREAAIAAAKAQAAASQVSSCGSSEGNGWPLTNITAIGTDCNTAHAVANGMSGAGSDTVSTGYSAMGFSCSLISGDPAITTAGQTWNYKCSRGSSSVQFTLVNQGG